MGKSCDSVYARDRLIITHLPLARRIARQNWSRIEPLEDLEQVAAVGLVKAADGFEHERQIPFAAYAIPKIQGEIWRYLRDYPGMIRVPRPVQELQGRLRRAGREVLSDGLDPQDVPTLAARVETDERVVREALSADRIRFPSSLEQPTGTNGIPVHEFLGRQDPGIAAIEERETLKTLLIGLPERERLIVFLTVLVGMSQRQVAKVVGMSQMHVSRLRTAAIERLRRQLRSIADPW